MPLQPKRGLAGLKRCHHGGIDYAEMAALGMKPEDVTDFSVCTNPFMPPPEIREIIGKAPVERYPDSAAAGLRESIAAHLGISTDNILAGNGTTEIIRLIATAYFRQGDGILTIEPTYGEYETAARIAGAKVIKYRAPEEKDFSLDMEEFAGLIGQHHPRSIFVCNPNNPTGKYLSRREIETIINTAGDGCLVVLDEAYIDFVGERWNSLDLIGRGNLLVLRSMTKAYGIPGLRLGYAVADREIIEILRRVCPPWNVNAVAQEAGIAVLKNNDYLKRSLRQTEESKNYLANEMARLGFRVLPSDANYFLVKVGDAASCRRALLAQGIMVRDGTSFGLPAHIRIAARTMPECQRLIESFERLLEDKSGGDL